MNNLQSFGVSQRERTSDARGEPKLTVRAVRGKENLTDWKTRRFLDPSGGLDEGRGSAGHAVGEDAVGIWRNGETVGLTTIEVSQQFAGTQIVDSNRRRGEGAVTTSSTLIGCAAIRSSKVPALNNRITRQAVSGSRQ